MSRGCVLLANAMIHGFRVAVLLFWFLRHDDRTRKRFKLKDISIVMSLSLHCQNCKKCRRRVVVIATALPPHRRIAATSPPHRRHIAATLPPHRRHIAATLPPHCRHVAATLPPHCRHIAATSPPHCRHIAATLPPHCRHIAATLPPHRRHSCHRTLFLPIRSCFGQTGPYWQK